MNPPTDWEHEPPAMVAERAARRAIEAMSRVGTLNTDVRSIEGDIALLRAHMARVEGVVNDLVGLVEALLGAQSHKPSI